MGAVVSENTAYFDITDLLSFLDKSPIVTGIQRVQVEAILALQGGEQPGGDCKCAYFGSDFVWRAVSVGEFCALFGRTDLSDAKWQAQVSKFINEVLHGGEVEFAAGDTLYFLGATWGIPGLFESLRDPRCEGVRFVFYLHDIIPIKFPEYFTPDSEVIFSYWIFNISFFATAVICNSHSTRKDFVEKTGFDRPTSVVNLNIKPNFALTDTKSCQDYFLAKNGLSPQAYVLMVGTVEPRKNHIAIVNVWTDLKRRFGKNCPKLVIVGRIGWNARDICQHIAMMSRETDILHLRNVRDEELAQLYEHCFFTVYASRYEGWGLPVTESLAFGKVCVSGNNSSLPEAGQGLTVLMDDRSERDIGEKVSNLIKNPVLVSKQEKRIRSKVRFKTWLDFGCEIRAIESVLPSVSVSTVPTIDPDTSYWFGRGKWSNAFSGNTPGELLRTGPGWRPAEDWGSWCNSQKSEILFGLSSDGDYDCYLLVVGPPGGAKLRLVSGNGPIWEGLVVKQKLIWGRLGMITAGEQVRLEVQCEELAEPSRWPTPPAGPTFGAGWIAMRVQHREDEGACTNENHKTLSVLREFLELNKED